MALWIDEVMQYPRGPDTPRIVREPSPRPPKLLLSSLAVEGRVTASTQNQALSALLFLYRHVLHQDLPWLDDAACSTRDHRTRWRTLGGYPRSGYLAA
jgi:hypothetical protein